MVRVAVAPKGSEQCGGGGCDSLCNFECATRHNSGATAMHSRHTAAAAQWQIDAVTKHEVPAVAAAASSSVELKLRFRSRRNHSVTFRWTVSQSRRRLTNYNNNLPRRCYKLQRQHPFAAPFPPSPSPAYYLNLASTRSKFLVKHRHEICLKICSCSPKRERVVERK